MISVSKSSLSVSYQIALQDFIILLSKANDISVQKFTECLVSNRIARFLNLALKSRKQKFYPIGICDEEDGWVDVHWAKFNQTSQEHAPIMHTEYLWYEL